MTVKSTLEKLQLANLLRPGQDEELKHVKQQLFAEAHQEAKTLVATWPNRKAEINAARDLKGEPRI